MTPGDIALVRLGSLLRRRGYRFTTITPESHTRVNRRRGNERARSLDDIFGWSRPFAEVTLASELLSLLEESESLEHEGGLLRSRIRFSTADDFLFLHSAFPTTGADSVFFGPDTYRYLALLRRLRPAGTRAVDVGCGSGAGGILIAANCETVILSDVNEVALRYAAINAAINEVENVEIVRSDILREIADPIDLVISNPPYLIDESARLYRDGRGHFGEGISVEIVRQSIQRLRRPGRLVLYSATAFVEGIDTFRQCLEPLLKGLPYHYQEIDPDVFGNELDRDAYATVDRLAVIGLDVSLAGLVSAI